MTGLAGLGLGHPHARHLGVAEDHLRDGRGTIGLVGDLARDSCRDPRANDPGLVLAPVGERRSAAGVTDGVQPLGQPTAGHVVRTQPDGVEPEVVEPRRAADGQQHLVGLEVAGRRGEGDGAAVDAAEPGRGGIRTTYVAHLRAEVDRDAPLAQARQHRLARERLGAGEQSGVAHDQGDRGAEGRHPDRGLAGDDATPDDHQPVGDLDHAGRVARVPRHEVGVHLRDVRLAARRNDHGPAGVQPSGAGGGGDLDGALPDESPGPADHSDAGVLDPRRLARVVVMGDPGVAALEQRLGCDVRG